MKLLKFIKCYNHIELFYENGIENHIYDNGETYWFQFFERHKEDGAAKKNCDGCIDNKCPYYAEYSKYKRHFHLAGHSLSPKIFAKETNHVICLICNDFCKQDCFFVDII